MHNVENIPDPRGDFREWIDFATPEIISTLHDSQESNKQHKITRTQINAKKGFRLTHQERASLTLEIIITTTSNKTLAEKYGVTHQRVSQLRKNIERAAKLPKKIYH